MSANPIWFMTTRGRPEQCRELIAAFRACGELPRVAVVIDGADQFDAYRDVPWPKEWDILPCSAHREMTACINWLYALYPDRSSYGFFADHFRPRPAMWGPRAGMWNDLALAAGDWLMAWPTQYDDPNMSSMQMAGAPTFGGKLIRELGWICLPETVHIATEGPFQTLWEHLGNVKVLKNHTFGRTWPLGPDLVPRSFEGRDYNWDDLTAFHLWKTNKASAIIAIIREKMKADGFEFGPHGRLHPKYGCASYGRAPVKFMQMSGA